MKFVNVSLLVLMCIMIRIKCERTRSLCQGCHRDEYDRIKRAKYYPNPPIRFYSRPPMTYPIKGPFSYTPPPGWMEDDRPQSSRPKVSGSQQINEGLGDEDITNIMKFLSKQDLDKIVGFASEKEKETPKYTFIYENPNDIVNKREKHESKLMFDDNDSVSSIEYKFPHYEHFVAQHGFRPYSSEYKPDRAMQNQQLSTYNQGANEIRNEANIFTGSNLMQEEQLPKPSNLREDDFEVSFTNNVPTILRANSNSYKIENLGSLPLMNYHSKLESVDSYKVPHYTVTSPEKHRAPASMINVPVEPAPPVSTAQEQSDAHLKAIKIWTHKSRGTAYTLHNDGTLSLEKRS